MTARNFNNNRAWPFSVAISRYANDREEEEGGGEEESQPLRVYHATKPERYSSVDLCESKHRNSVTNTFCSLRTVKNDATRIFAYFILLPQ